MKFRKFFSISLILMLSFSRVNFASNVNAKISNDNISVSNKIKEKMGHMLSQEYGSTPNEELDPNEEISILVQVDENSQIDMSKDLNDECEKQVKKSQEEVIDEVEKITGNKIQDSFTYLVNGFSIKGKRKDIDKIEKIKNVKSVEESEYFKPTMYSANQIIDTYKEWEDCGYKGEGMVISVIDTGIDCSHKDFQNIDSSKISITKEDSEEKIKELGRGKYFSDKIPFGYNYADDDYNIKNTINQHGMHVAGIIGANGDPDEEGTLESVIGVAPEAQILAMKVSSENGGGFYSEDVIKAIEDSVKLGADIINMSFGSEAKYRSNENLYTLAIDKASEAGVLCVNAAGNDQVSTTTSTSTTPKNSLGIKDTALVNNPSDNSLCVASMENDKKVSEGQIVENYNSGKMSYFTSWGPSANLELKPEITAPGGYVYSTLNNDAYGTYRGTSMASPIVAGGEALILQKMKNHNINLSGSELINYLKGMLMSSAVPLKYENDYGDEVIYSPRQQGAGVINVNNAVKNNVMIKDENNEHYLRLNNIDGTKEFKIYLTNYGNESITYNLEEDKLYSEITEDSRIQEVIVDDAKIEYNSKSITVQANSTAELTGKIIIPEDFEKQNFIEGYINLKSSSENVPSLSFTVFGFYGDYGDETILDKPIYDEDSILNITGLGKGMGNKFNYYGSSVDEEGNISVNPNNIAFSPNQDGVQDSVSAITYFLRNADYYKMQVLDKDKNLLGNEMEYDNVIKSVSYDKAGNTSKRNKYYYTWYGNMYDISTGTNKVVADGQYYIRLITKGYSDNAKEQIIDIPVKVDTIAPKVEIIGIDKEELESGNYYEISWKCSDDNSGISNLATVTYNDDEDNMVELTDIKEEDGIYSAEISITEGEMNKITLGVSDYAGNVGLADTFYNASVEIEDPDPDSGGGVIEYVAPVKFYNLVDDSTVKVGRGRLTIKGIVREDVGSVMINDQIATIEDDLSLKKIEYLTEGENIIDVKVFDKEEKEIYQKSYTIYLDTIRPEFESISPSAEDKVYAVTDDYVNIDLKVKDASLVQCEAENETNYEDINTWLDKNGEGTIEMPLDDGLNIINLSLTDKAGNNSETRTLLVVRVDDLSTIKVGLTNLESCSYRVGNNTDEDGYFLVEGYVTEKPAVLKINDQKIDVNKNLIFSTKIKFNEGLNKVRIYAEDYDGNVCQEYAYKVFFDSESPIITLDKGYNIDSEGTIYTNQKNFELKMASSDTANDYKVYLNGNLVITTGLGSTGTKEQLERKINKIINLNEGENIITLRIVDTMGNENLYKIKVKLSTKVPNMSNINTQTDLINNKVIINISPTEPYTKILYGYSNWFYTECGTTLKVGKEKSVVTIKYIDMYGNESKVAYITINDDGTTTVSDTRDNNKVMLLLSILLLSILTLGYNYKRRKIVS